MFQLDRERAVALGIWTASFALGGIVGPLIGGLLIEAVSWRAVFAITPPAMLILLIFGPLTLPEYRSDMCGGPMCWESAWQWWACSARRTP